MRLGLRYDLRLPGADARQRAAYFDVAIDQIRWADRLGFESVSLMEHHGSDDGYLPSPIVFAAAISQRTEHITVRLSALIATLHDPVRLAEDLAVLDILLKGRLVIVIGAGYVSSEFDMFDKKINDRPQLINEVVDVLKKAWSSRPFEYRGKTIRVVPQPYQDPRPTLLLGGMSKGSARRAARIADGYVPTSAKYYDDYRAALGELGRPDPGPLAVGRVAPSFLYLAEDPDRAWSAIAPYCLHEMNSYGKWAKDAGLDSGYAVFDDVDELRATNKYLVLTPDDAVQLGRETGALTFHPLCGGMDPELSWASLNLFETKVLPQLSNP